MTGPSGGLFARSCWLCRRALSCHQRGFSSVGLARVFVAVRQRADAVLLDPALGVEGGERRLVKMHPEDLVAFALEPVHSVLEGSLAEKGLLVVLVVDLFLCDNLGGALCFLFVFAALDFDGVHLGAQADDL